MVAKSRAQLVEEWVPLLEPIWLRSIRSPRWVTEASYNAYQLRFTECKKTVTEAFLGLKLDDIIDAEPEKDKEGVEEGKAKEATKETTGLNMPLLKRLLLRWSSKLRP